MIKDFKAKQAGAISGVFMITKLEFKPFANKPGTFLSCDLSDRTGSLKAVMWDGIAPIKAWIGNKMVVQIHGELNTYKDNLQVILKNLNPVEAYNKADFIPSLPFDKTVAIMAGIDKYWAQIKDPFCQIIWKEVLEVGKLRGEFQTCPGGVGEVHHNYIGGLAEHTYGMMRLSENAPPELDRDIILTGCLIHDMGKIKCYNWDASIEMTDMGRLLRHTTTGYEMLCTMTSERTGAFLKLAHIIVAHHELDGLVKTEFPEATAVANLDAMDAVLNHAMGFIGKEENREPGTNWTKFCHLTGKKYYIPIKTATESIKGTPEIKKSPLKVENIDINDILMGMNIQGQ